MFTRDLSLEDCVLDLIDNSIDGLVRSRGIDVASSILNGGATSSHAGTGSLRRIEVSYSEKEFKIEDTCGGIDRKDALEDVFNFGHAEGETGGGFGGYGDGVKRAHFENGKKLANEMINGNEG